MKFHIDHFYLALGWGFYFFLHSLLAANKTKKYLKIKFRIGNPMYRLVYSIISTVGLIVLLLFNISIPSEMIINNTSLAIYVGLMLTGVGLAVIVRAFKYYNLKAFIGLETEHASALRKDGLLNRIRHPLYSGTILVVLGFWCFIPDYTTLITVIITFLYLPIGIWLEEKKLIKEYGQDYIQYRRKVPGVIPRIRNN